MQFAGQNDLTLGDVSGQVRDGVGLVVFGHGQNGDHGDGAILALTAAGAFVHGRKVRVHVAGISTTSGNFLLCCRDLTESFCIVGDIGDDDQDLHVLLKGQVFRSSQCHTRSGDTFYCRVICQVGEDNRTVDSTGLTEGVDEVLGLFERDTDGCEHNGEFLVIAKNLCLTGDLSCQSGVGQTGAGEDGKLLATDQSVQTIDGGNAGLDELCGIGTGCRVHGQAVDIHVCIGQDLGTAVDGGAHAVEDTAEHILGNCELQRMSQEADLGLGQVDALCGLKQLYDCLVTFNFQYFAAADFAVGKFQFSKFVIGNAADVIYDHQRAGDFFYSFILFNHSSALSSTTFSICSFILMSISL